MIITVLAADVSNSYERDIQTLKTMWFKKKQQSVRLREAALVVLAMHFCGLIPAQEIEREYGSVESLADQYGIIIELTEDGRARCYFQEQQPC
jgi:hypothetical protein